MNLKYFWELVTKFCKRRELTVKEQLEAHAINRPVIEIYQNIKL